MLTTARTFIYLTLVVSALACSSVFASPAITQTSNSSELTFTLQESIKSETLPTGEVQLTAITGVYRIDDQNRKLPGRLEWIILPPNQTIGSIVVQPLNAKTRSGSVPIVSDAARLQQDPVSAKFGWAEAGLETGYLGHRIVPVTILFARQTETGIVWTDHVSVTVRFVPARTPSANDRIAYAPPPEFAVNWQAAATWRAVSVKPRSAMDETNQLPVGPLFRITTETEGITRITGTDLARAGANLAQINPTTLKMYSNGGAPLDRTLFGAVPDNWAEIAIVVEDGGDGSFDPNDRILFYGERPSGWTRDLSGNYSHWLSPYLRSVTYFLDLGRVGTVGKRMAPLAPAGSQSQLNTSIGRAFVEEEMSLYADASFTGSGIRWVGSLFSGSITRNYSLALPGAITTADAACTSRWVYVSYGSQVTNFYFSLNNQPFDTNSAVSGNIRATVPGAFLREGNNTLTIRKSGDGSYYQDWIEMEYARDWVLRSGRFIGEAAQAGAYRVSLTAPTTPYVFEVSDRLNASFIKATSFSDVGASNSFRRYVAAEEHGMLAPVAISFVQMGGEGYTDLRDASLQADYLLIYDDDYATQARRLADYRRTHDHVSVKMIRIRDIYDQFATGNLDPVAVRNFIKYSVESWARPAPKYVMFFGDGDYDYRGIIQPNGERPIPAYEEGGTCTDDYYVRISSQSSPPELVTARLTVVTPQQADFWIDKLIAYEAEPPAAGWRSRIILCADDEYGEGHRFASWETTHASASEELDQELIPPYLDRAKIYLIEYPGYFDPVQTAMIKPDATNAFLTELERGALIVNWIGHGNPRVWAHEQLLRESRDLPLLNMGNRLPLWLAFTCDWAYWDDPSLQSFPEKMLALPNNGAIGIIAATRLTGPDANERLAQQWFNAQFDTLSQPRRSIAEALQLAKIRAGNLTNSSYYHALCDPLTRLTIPSKSAWVDSVMPSPLIPLSPASVVGRVGIHAGTPDSTATGNTYLVLRSAKQPYTYYWDRNTNNPFHYTKPGRLLFRGSARTEQGDFTVPVMLPIDATYGDTNVTATVLSSGSWGAGAGVKSGIQIAMAPAIVNDTLGPTIKLYLNSRDFKSGDVVNDVPTLIADISDSSGVNATGELGHRIIAIVDGLSFDYTEQFSYSAGDVTRGTVETPLRRLPSGPHTLSLRVFDGANNIGLSDIEFEVVSAPGNAEITRLLNVPNPVKKSTRFTFESTVAGTATIEIFSVAGTSIRKLEGLPVNIGFNYPLSAEWDGRDRNGADVANGAYIWKVIVKTPDGKTAKGTGRAAVVR